MTATATKALHALRQFACLGVPLQTAMPNLTTALAAIVPFDTWSMAGLGADLKPNDVFASDDIDPGVLSRYAERWYDAEETRFYPTQSQMQTDARLKVIRVSDYTAKPHETEIYDEIYRHQEHGWIAGVALYRPGAPIGNIGLGRPPKAKDFSADEMALLAEARGYLVQALSRRDAAMPNLGPSSIRETAFLVCDAAGRILHQTGNAWRLLRWAAGVPANLDVLADTACDWAVAHLGELTRRVEGGLLGRPARPAAIQRKTAYGEFALRAYAMQDSLGGGAMTFGVQVEQHAPLALQIFSEPGFLALPNREQTVARLIIQGATQGQMAEQLGVKPSTVVSHVRNLYDRLEVSRREDVAGALMTMH